MDVNAFNLVTSFVQFEENPWWIVNSQKYVVYVMFSLWISPHNEFVYICFKVRVFKLKKSVHIQNFSIAAAILQSQYLILVNWISIISTISFMMPINHLQLPDIIILVAFYSIQMLNICKLQLNILKDWYQMLTKVCQLLVSSL